MSGGVWELTSSTVAEIDSNIGLFGSFGKTFITRGGDYKSSAKECETKSFYLGGQVYTGARLILKH